MAINQTHHLYSIWDKVPVDYYQKGVKRNLLQKIWHKKKITLLAKILKTIKFDNLLDVGCASGYMLVEVAQRFPQAKYYGIDSYDKVIEHARKTYPGIDFQVASADDLPFKDQYFDAVISYETIEHVEDPLATLKEIRRVLKPEGTAVVAMDSGNWLFRIVWFVWENTKGRVWRGAHLHPFYHKELGEIIDKSGLKVKEKIFSHWGMEVVFVLGR